MPDQQFTVYDGFDSLQGGMNGGTLNTLIDRNQFAKGINVTCRNGLIGTRPPVVEVDINGSEAELDAIQNGKFQGAYYYQYEDNNYIAFAMSGEIFLIDPIANTIWDMTAVIGAMSATVNRLHFCQVERYLVVQDGTNTPVIIEDTASRLAVQVPDNEVPTGTIMAYVHGRLFIKTGQYEFVAGNIHMPNTVGNVLVFTENQYLAGGGALFVPVDLGQITGMSWAQAYGEATGEGPLLVLCERGIASFQVNIPRLSWQDMPISRIEPGGNGNASEYCAVRMNEDLMFMSWNGIQDYALLSVEAATHHRMTNLAFEIKPFMDLESVTLRSLSMGCKFDDRLLFTAIGEEVTTPNDETDYRFAGLISLDFSPMNGIASLGKTVKPAYDGMWTGMHPTGIASGIFNQEEMCFIFGKDDDGINHLYRLHKTQGHDTTVADGEIPIDCILYTKGMPFTAFDADQPRQVPQIEKELDNANMTIIAFQDEVTFALSACPDFTTAFSQITSLTVNAPMETTDAVPIAGNPQSRPKERFPAIQHNLCEQISGRNVAIGHEFQFRLSWSGIANISRFSIQAEGRRETTQGHLECGSNATVQTVDAPNDFLYDINDQ